MPYTINRFSNDTGDSGWPLTVQDGRKNVTATNITFLGKGSINYGKDIAENFLRLLENFASNTSPSSPISGQLWYKPNTKELYVCVQNTPNIVWKRIQNIRKGSTIPSVLPSDSEGDVYLQTISSNNLKLWIFNGTTWLRQSSLILSSTAPSDNNVGDLWYDTANNSLKIYTGIGPLNWLNIVTSDLNNLSDIKMVDVSGKGVIAFISNGDVIASFSESQISPPLPSSPVDLNTYFPNGIEVGFNLSDVVTNNKIYSNGNLKLGENIEVSKFIIESVEDNISASGTTQATAYLLKKSNNFVNNIVPGVNEGVRLPDPSTSGGIGLVLTVWNLTSNNLNIYPHVGGIIDNLAVNVPYVLTSNDQVTFVSRTLTEYRTR